MHVHVTNDPEEIREIKTNYFKAGTEFHLVPILEFPEDGLEESGWDDVCIQIFKSEKRVVICSPEFAVHLERMENRMEECVKHLSDTLRAAECTVRHLSDRAAECTVRQRRAESLKIGCDGPKLSDNGGTRAAEADKRSLRIVQEFSDYVKNRIPIRHGLRSPGKAGRALRESH